MEINNPKMKKKRKRNSAIKALLAIFLILLILLIGVGVYYWINYEKIRGDLGEPGVITTDFDTDPEAEDLPEVTYSEGEIPDLLKKEGVVDIMLVGVDNRDITEFTGRSDVLMYLRIDKNHDSIKLVSIMRDTLVPIKDHGYNKINTAYMYGSAELASHTLSTSLGLQPDYYVVVNFYGMEDIIDAFGGVDVDLTQDEVNHLNGSIEEINQIDPDNRVKHVSGPGVRHLNGRQAVAYMRVRKVGGDQARVLRQQTVLKELFKTAKDMNIAEITGMIGTVSDYVRTDMGLTTMIDLASVVKGMGSTDINTFRYPDALKIGNYKGMSIVQPEDFNADVRKLHDFLEN